MDVASAAANTIWNDERLWERPRINQMTLSFLLLLMLLVSRAAGSSSTEFEIYGLLRSDLMSLNELETAYCRMDSVSTLK